MKRRIKEYMDGERRDRGHLAEALSPLITAFVAQAIGDAQQPATLFCSEYAFTRLIRAANRYHVLVLDVLEKNFPNLIVVVDDIKRDQHFTVVMGHV